MTTKCLNAYAGIGGNRKLWDDVDVVAVEWNREIAEVYQDHFPNDDVIVADAHDFLLNHFDDGFDFIWLSPPCPTHSKMRKHFGLNDDRRSVEPVYPDMRLYQEIIFLRHHFDGHWVVENVEPYYKPLIPGTKVGRHYMWSNFPLPTDVDDGKNLVGSYTIDGLQDAIGFDLSDYRFDTARKDQVLKNAVHPNVGRAVFDAHRTTTTIDAFA